MKLDKKASKEKITFILPTDYSKVEIFEFTEPELADLIS